MSTNREVVVSIGAEISGVRGAEVLNRQIQTLEQSTANGLARLQATASRMTHAGSSMATWYAKADANFQSMQARASQWATSIERTWGAFSSRLQAFQGGVQNTANGVESLVKSWTILTGSEEDLSKLIKRLLVINALFDSIRGSAALVSGIRDIGLTMAGGTAAQATASGVGTMAGSTVGGAAGAAGARIAAGSSATSQGGFAGMTLSSNGVGATGGTALSTGTTSTLGLSAGFTAFLVVSAVLATLSISALVSQVAAEYQGRWLNWLSGNTTDQDTANAASRNRFSRRMQRETGISLFEVNSLEGENFQLRTRVRQATQPHLDNLQEMRLVPMQMQLENQERMRALRIADANRNAQFLMGQTARPDATAGSFQSAWNANAYASMLSLRNKTPSAERVTNEARLQQLQGEYDTLTNQANRLRMQQQQQSSAPRYDSERTWGDFLNLVNPLAYQHNFVDVSRSPRQRQPNVGNRWMRLAEQSQMARMGGPVDPGGGRTPAEALVEIEDSRRRLAEEMLQLKRKGVQLTMQEREVIIQTATQERQRYQQAHEFHRNQAQALRDQQRGSMGGFGYMPLDQQQRALRIANAISSGRGHMLSQQDLEFGRGQESLSELMSFEGRRRAQQQGIFQQIENIAAPGGLSRNQRIALNDREAARSMQMVNQFAIELQNNISLQPNAVASEIERTLVPAMQQLVRTVTETFRQEMKITMARGMAQDFLQRQKSTAANQAAAGTP